MPDNQIKVASDGQRVYMRSVITSPTPFVMYPCLGCLVAPRNIEVSGTEGQAGNPPFSYFAPTYSMGGFGRGATSCFGLTWDGSQVWFTRQTDVGTSLTKNEIRRISYPSGSASTLVYRPGGASNNNWAAECPTLDGSGNIWFIEAKSQSIVASTVCEIRYVSATGGSSTIVRSFTKVAGTLPDVRQGAIVWNPYNGYLYYVELSRNSNVSGAPYTNSMNVMTTGGATVATYVTLFSPNQIDPGQIHLNTYEPLAVDSAGTVWCRSRGKSPAGKETVAVGFRLDGTIVYADGRRPGQTSGGSSFALVPLPTNLSYSDPTYTVAGQPVGPVGTEAQGVILSQATIGSGAGAVVGFTWADQNGDCWFSPCRGGMPAGYPGGDFSPVFNNRGFAFMPDHSSVLFTSNTSDSTEWWSEIPCPD